MEYQLMKWASGLTEFRSIGKRLYEHTTVLLMNRNFSEGETCENIKQQPAETRSWDGYCYEERLHLQLAVRGSPAETVSSLKLLLVNRSMGRIYQTGKQLHPSGCQEADLLPITPTLIASHHDWPTPATYKLLLSLLSYLCRWYSTVFIL